jgi:hypothetical protein
MSSDEIEIEAVPGLPEELPPGERVLWQGRPEWRALARHTFKVRWLVGYFALFAALRLAASLEGHQGLAGALQVVVVAVLAAVCLGVLNLLAWLYARATIYTITTQRVVFRIGVALPMTWNLPFKRLASADLQVRKQGDGDIVLKLTAPNRIAWLHLWPHVQPWHYVKARPTLRAIPEPAKVAAVLADAVKLWSATRTAPAAAVDAPASKLTVAVSEAPHVADRARDAREALHSAPSAPSAPRTLATEAGH